MFKAGPAGLRAWDREYPELFRIHGQAITLAALAPEGPARELARLVEAHPELSLYRTEGGAVWVEGEAWARTSEQAAAVYQRALGLAMDHAEEVAHALGASLPVGPSPGRRVLPGT